MDHDAMVAVLKGLAGKSLPLGKVLTALNSPVRNFVVREKVNAALAAAGLTTDPDWTVVDREIVIRIGPITVSPDAQSNGSSPTDDEIRFDGIDPSVGALLPPEPPTTFSVDTALNTAVTSMVTGSVAHFPVVDGQGALKGALTWKSYAQMMAANNPRTLLNAVDRNPPTIQDTADLLDAVSVIADHGYVVVRGPQGSVRGVLTLADLAIRYRDMLAPFQKIGEIERTLRRCTTARLSVTDFQDTFGDGVNSAEKLTFGQYRPLLQEPARWAKFGLEIDKSWFCDLLMAVKETRNELAHFKGDKLAPHQLDEINDLLGLLRSLDPR